MAAAQLWGTLWWRASRLSKASQGKSGGSGRWPGSHGGDIRLHLFFEGLLCTKCYFKHLAWLFQSTPKEGIVRFWMNNHKHSFHLCGLCRALAGRGRAGHIVVNKVMFSATVEPTFRLGRQRWYNLTKCISYKCFWLQVTADLPISGVHVSFFPQKSRGRLLLLTEVSLILLAFTSWSQDGDHSSRHCI